MPIVTRIQTGTTTISDTTSSAVATVSSYTASLSLLLMMPVEGDDNPDNSQVKGAKTSSTQLTFSRNGTSGDIVVRWFLIEFAGSVSIQNVNYTSSGTTAISAVTLSRAFIVTAGHSEGGATQDESDFYELSLPNSTVVSHIGNPINDGELQVVDYPSCSVQVISNTAGTAATTINETISSVDPEKSIVVGTAQPNDALSNLLFEDVFRAKITSPTNVQLNRQTTWTSEMDYTLYVVEFADGWRVQRGTESFGTTDQTKDVTINRVHIPFTAAKCNGVHSGGLSHCQSDAANDDYGDSRVKAFLQNETTLRIQRILFATPGPNLEVDWEVMEYIPEDDIVPNF